MFAVSCASWAWRCESWRGFCEGTLLMREVLGLELCDIAESFFVCLDRP